MPSVSNARAKQVYADARAAGFSADQARRMRTMEAGKVAQALAARRAGAPPARATPPPVRVQRVTPQSVKTTLTHNDALRVITTRYGKSEQGYSVERVNALLDLRHNDGRTLDILVRVIKVDENGKVVAATSTRMWGRASRARLLMDYADAVQKLNQSFPGAYQIEIVERRAGPGYARAGGRMVA